MLNKIRLLTEDALRAPDPVLATDAFHSALRPHGITYLQSRAYRRPAGLLTADSHWQAGGFVARYARPGWIGSTAHKYICFEENPLLEPIRNGQTRYRFSDFAPRHAQRFAAYWQAMEEGGIVDALCATAYGPARRTVSFHIGFDHAAFLDEEARVIQIAALMLAECMIDAVATEDQPGAEGASKPLLTIREADVMRYVAEGKTDWEIGAILSISESTARFHVDNARRKLNAVNRAHAVARFLAVHSD